MDKIWQSMYIIQEWKTNKQKKKTNAPPIISKSWIQKKKKDLLTNLKRSYYALHDFQWFRNH